MHTLKFATKPSLRATHHPALYRALQRIGYFCMSMVIFSASRFEPAATQITEKSSLGGYGEVHLNYTRPSSGTPAAPKLDFHRWILFVNHQWNDQWSLNAELELEHNLVEGGSKSGELELEQAYIQYRPDAAFALQAGVVLPAIGLINDKHEPTKFLSVERPLFANVIIPTTWYGNGLGVRGLLFQALQYNLVVMEGLDDRRFKSAGIRGGRQKGYQASLETVLLNPAVDFIMYPGLTVGSSAAINVLVSDPTNTHPYRSTVLWGAHAHYKKDGVWAQAEFGTSGYHKNDDLPGVDSLALLERSMGWYADIGYDVARLWKARQMQLYPVVRYTQVNAADDLGANGTVSRFLFGLAVYPIDKVVFKIDYARESKQGTTGWSGLFNAGAGYEF